MTRAFAGITLTPLLLTALLSASAFGQPTAAKPTFQIADVRALPQSPAQNSGIGIPAMVRLDEGVIRAGRFEIRRATMLNLIRIAYGVDPDTIVGGPAWLETDRFDVIAKAPPSTSLKTAKLMLQSLLADRFKLSLHKDTRPIQGFVLSTGKGKPKLKPADASGEPGCEFREGPLPTPDFIPPETIACRNTTMDAFAPILRGMAGAYLTGPVLDSTGLKGAWDFDLKWTSRGLLLSAGADAITLFDAVDKQLGLKLEPGKVPMPVIVVDGVNQKPTANSPDVKTALPAPAPAEFEVASLRPNLTDAFPPPAGDGLHPGGRYELHNLPLILMVRLAWDVNTPIREEIPGTPKWLTLEAPRFDLIAKVPASAIANGTEIDTADMQAMIRALLVDRFKMAVHFEDRPMDAYTIVADKPKLKKSDPSSRTGCKTVRAPRDPEQGPPPLVATCQNITMAQFAEQLSTIAPNYIRYPALDGSGIEGAWDFTLSFSPMNPNQQLAGGGGRNGGTKGGGPSAGVLSDPSGAVSLFDAMEKQLGLKLELHKRTEPVFVIDHIEEKPIDN
ncbi:MAG TPA: TIGR03435 family protein [Bryobacteraceae bacterium]|jgi:uncharacterized protein (TIGR03435 family)